MSKKSRDNAVITRLLADIDRLNDMLSDSFQLHLLGALQRMEERAEKAEAKLAEAQRWIPVGERLPKQITNKVIVYCTNGYTGYGHYEKFSGREVWYNLENQKPFTDWDSGSDETYKVTHWMPLPEPPKGEEK